MVYVFLNACVIIVTLCIDRFCFKNKIGKDYTIFYPILTLCLFQAIIVLIVSLFDNAHLPVDIPVRAHIFLVYYCLVALFRFACVYKVKYSLKLINAITFIATAIIFYYAFFYLDASIATLQPSSTIFTEDTFFKAFELGQHAFTPYAFILPGASLLILTMRALIVKDNVVRFQLVMIACMYITIIFFYVILVFGGNYNHSLNYLFSFVTLYVLLVLYRISLVNHVLSLKKAIKALRNFFWEYMFFAVFVTLAFILFFEALQINTILFSILGLSTIFILFFVQASIRKKNKATYIRDTAEVTLGSFFSNIDYSKNKEILFTSFTDMLTEVFDTSAIDFFVVEGDNLHVTYSTRNIDVGQISLRSKLFSTICASEVPVISKTSFYENRIFNDVQTEMEKLFEYCQSSAMIIIHGERSIIGLISFAEKKRSIDYSEHDQDLIRYFYSNFFVFGYYLKISSQETLMNVIRREIEFSGEVTESIYKNIDKIEHSTIELGYISRSLRNLGGDFIDLIRLTQDRHMLVVGDVSGRGLNASMCMIILKSFIRTFLSESDDFIGLLYKLNSFIKHNLPRGTFFAGTFMIFDNSNNMLYYVNCGVPGIFLFTKTYNNVIEIQGDGKVLGFIDNRDDFLTVKKIQLNEGDIVLTCSDGVTESLSLRGEEYGKRRIKTLLHDNKLFPAQNICSFLLDDLQSFTAKGISDDISILTLKILQ